MENTKKRNIHIELTKEGKGIATMSEIRVADLIHAILLLNQTDYEVKPEKEKHNSIDIEFTDKVVITTNLSREECINILGAFILEMGLMDKIIIG